MSSPARSSVSATSGGHGAAAAAAFGGETSPRQYPTGVISAQERKDEALALMKTELMAELQKEVKSLDEDGWMFAGPRSQIHLISTSGGYQHMQTRRS